MAAAVSGRTVPAPNLLPASFTTDHATDGLPGWGADDWFRPAGTIVGTPVAGTVERTGGAAGSRGGGVYGRSVYLKTDSGQRLFLTHFSEIFVRDRQRLEPGEPLGRVAPYGNASHIHVAAQGAADKGGKVDLYGGSRNPNPVGRAADAAEDAVRGAVGGAADAAEGAVRGRLVDELKSLFDFGSWGIRAVQVTGGFVLLLVGLVLLGKQLGVPAPERIPLPGPRDLYQRG